MEHKKITLRDIRTSFVKLLMVCVLLVTAFTATRVIRFVRYELLSLLSVYRHCAVVFW